MGSVNNDPKLLDANTGYPGHVYNFDKETQTCDVQLAIENVFTGYSAAYKLIAKQRLVGVPVSFKGAGGYSLTHSVPDKTPCYVHFAQRGIEHWLTENKSEAGLVDGLPSPAFSQLFSHNNAVCEIGHRPLTEVIEDFLDEGMEIRNSDRSQRVTLRADKSIEIVTGAASAVLYPSGEVVVIAQKKATTRAPEITLDGKTTVTQSLTVLGGMSVSNTTKGGTAMTINGKTDVTGDLLVDGVKVNKHDHRNPEGGRVGPMGG